MARPGDPGPSRPPTNLGHRRDLALGHGVHHLLATPELAMNQVRREIVRMAQIAKSAVNQAVEGLVENDRRKLDTARVTEDVTDRLQYEITSYVAAGPSAHD